MLEQPSGVALLQCARDVLKNNVLPLLSGDAKRDVLMVMNAMFIAQRETELGSTPEEAEKKSLSTLLDVLVVDLKQANRVLGARIRAGKVDPGTEEYFTVLAHLRQTGRNRLQVSNPKVLKAESA